METRITFEISGEQYTMFVEGFFKKKYYLLKKNRDSMFADNISVNVSANTHGEMVRHRLKAKKVVGMLCILSVFSLMLLPALYCYGIWNSEAFNSFGSEYSINSFDMRGRCVALQ